MPPEIVVPGTRLRFDRMFAATKPAPDNSFQQRRHGEEWGAPTDSPVEAPPVWTDPDHDSSEHDADASLQPNAGVYWRVAGD